MSKIELYIFRHGETDWNKEGRLQGHTDIPLNEMGKKQAEGLAEKMQKLNPQVVLTSDLKRAKETASIAFAQKKIPFLESVHLREGGLGAAEGMVLADIIENFGATSWERWRSWEKEHQAFKFPGGESKIEILARLTSHLHPIFLAPEKFQRIAISTHGGSLRALLKHSQGAPEIVGPVANCALYKIFFDPIAHSWHFGQIVD